MTAWIILLLPPLCNTCGRLSPGSLHELHATPIYILFTERLCGLIRDRSLSIIIPCCGLFGLGLQQNRSVCWFLMFNYLCRERVDDAKATFVVGRFFFTFCFRHADWARQRLVNTSKKIDQKQLDSLVLTSHSNEPRRTTEITSSTAFIRRQCSRLWEQLCWSSSSNQTAVQWNGEREHYCDGWEKRINTSAFFAVRDLLFTLDMHVVVHKSCFVWLGHKHRVNGSENVSVCRVYNFSCYSFTSDRVSFAEIGADNRNVSYVLRLKNKMT